MIADVVAVYIVIGIFSGWNKPAGTASIQQVFFWPKYITKN